MNRFLILVSALFILVPTMSNAQNAGQSGDFLAGILGEQKKTYEGEPNGGQTGKKDNDNLTNDELRLGIIEDEGSGDTADGGDDSGGDT